MLYKATGAKVHDIDKASGIVTVYANAFGNIDSDGDISAKGSFKKTLSENRSRMKWLLNHNPTQLLGVPFLDGSGEDDFGLKNRGKINLNKSIGADTFTDYQLFAENGRTLEHSIGFEIVKSHKEKADDKDIRVITEYKLYEVSTLTFLGANQNTPLVDLKSIDNTLELLEQQLKYNYSDERLEKVESMLLSLRKPSKDTSTEPMELTKLFYQSINTK